MIFDFNRFADITASVYSGGAYSIEDALSVFRYYFERYEEHTGRPCSCTVRKQATENKR